MEEDCGPGCVAIRTDIESGIVSCLGDGVDETLRYPADIYCTNQLIILICIFVAANFYVSEN